MKGVTFGNYYSYDDFSLVLTSKNIPLPKPKTYKIDVPCADGQLDLTTALTGGFVKYENRPISMKLTLMKNPSEISDARSLIANAIHGQVMNVTFDDDPEFYFKGRLTIDEFNTEELPATLTVNLDAEPYKYKQDIKVLQNSISGTKTVVIENQNMPVVPTINVSADITLVYKTKEYSLLSGDNIIPEVILSSGDNNSLTFKGTGNVKITYQEGEL